jgi:hypothetical protein
VPPLDAEGGSPLSLASVSVWCGSQHKAKVSGGGKRKGEGRTSPLEGKSRSPHVLGTTTSLLGFLSCDAPYDAPAPQRRQFFPTPKTRMLANNMPGSTKQKSSERVYHLVNCIQAIDSPSFFLSFCFCFCFCFQFTLFLAKSFGIWLPQ